MRHQAGLFEHLAGGVPRVALGLPEGATVADLDRAVDGTGERRVGNVYAFDRPNARIIALDKTDGSYRGQYRLAGGAEDWSDLRSMYIIPGIEEGPPTVVWLSENAVHQAVLEAVPDVASEATPEASPSAEPDASAEPSPAP